MTSWPIFDEDILGDLNHRSAEVHLEAGLHMTVIALLAGILSRSDIAMPEVLRGVSVVGMAIFVVTLAIFCLGILFVAYMARRKHEEIAATVPVERSRKAYTPWITRLLCLIAVMLVLFSMNQTGSVFFILVIMTGLGLISLSISEFLTDRPGTVRSSLVMVLAGAAGSIPMAIAFPQEEATSGFLVYLVMVALVMLELRLERAQVSWSHAFTDKNERVMRVILVLAALVAWLVSRDAESSRYD